MGHVYVVALTHLPIHTLCVWVAGIGSNTHAMYLLLIFGRVHSTDLYLSIYTHNNNIGKHFRMVDICLGAWGGRVEEGWD